MRSITLAQLRASASTGGVAGVTLRGRGGGFFVEIGTRSGHGAILSKARSIEPRRFGNPASAMIVLRELGIVVAQLDTTDWNPEQKNANQSRPSRARALRAAHQAAAYNKWLESELRTAVADPRPNLSHSKAMAAMDAELAALRSRKKKRA
jgi:hypothetical protein